jgi:hypothetical protein
MESHPLQPKPPAPPPTTAAVLGTFASLGASWQPTPKQAACVNVRPQSAYVMTTNRRPSSPTKAATSGLIPTLPTHLPTRRLSAGSQQLMASPRDQAAARSVPPPAASIDVVSSPMDSSAVASRLGPRRPLTAGARLLNPRSEFKAEMSNFAAGSAAAKATNAQVGPLKYDAEKSWRKTLPATPGCPFTSTPRLGIVAGHVADQQLASTLAAEKATAEATGDTTPRRRPLSARVSHVPGKGHWLDGMATGATIVGHYNRFLAQGPGAAAYDIRKSHDFCRSHTARTVFGTAGRFPGDRGVREGPPSPRNDAKATKPGAAAAARPAAAAAASVAAAVMPPRPPRAAAA